MSAGLEPLLRASLDAETPRWLDRLVVERVVSSVKNDAALSRAPRSAGAGARADRLLRQGWTRALASVGGWLIEGWGAARSAAARAAAVDRGRPFVTGLQDEAPPVRCHGDGGLGGAARGAGRS